MVKVKKEIIKKEYIQQKSKRFVKKKEQRKVSKEAWTLLLRLRARAQAQTLLKALVWYE
jgi:hypothetical protein